MLQTVRAAEWELYSNGGNMRIFLRFIIFIMVSSISSTIYAETSTDSFYSIEEWQAGNIDFGGEIRVQLDVTKITDDLIEITIQKDMTPFSPLLIFTSEAAYISGKYIFSGSDNIENFLSGYLILDEIEDGRVTLFFERTYASNFGKNEGRLYGETHILTRGTVQFE